MFLNKILLFSLEEVEPKALKVEHYEAGEKHLYWTQKIK
jgi:hypothetical protein